MTCQYVTATQATSEYAARAADYERRGLPRCAEDYRVMARAAAAIAQRVDAALARQEGHQP